MQHLPLRISLTAPFETDERDGLNNMIRQRKATIIRSMEPFSAGLNVAKMSRTSGYGESISVDFTTKVVGLKRFPNTFFAFPSANHADSAEYGHFIQNGDPVVNLESGAAIELCQGVGRSNRYMVG